MKYEANKIKKLVDIAILIYKKNRPQVEKHYWR